MSDDVFDALIIIIGCNYNHDKPFYVEINKSIKYLHTHTHIWEREWVSVM